MKNFIFGALTISMMLLISCSSTKDFQGKLDYTIDYDLPEEMEMQRGMLATKMTTYLGDGFTRIEQKAQTGDQISIYDVESESNTVLIDLMGKKIAITAMTEADENKPNYSIEETAETKKISGYDCKLAIFTVEKGEQKTPFEIYYTEKIPGDLNSQFPGLKGYPLQYSIETQGMTITYEAKTVTKEKVSNKLKEIPDGYEQMTTEEFIEMMGM